jgi:acyl-CoA synthetase (AMP-forming)/AMP-acid ligase II
MPGEALTRSPASSTGGTTGFPKGVMLSHANLITSALSTQATFSFVVPGGWTLHAAPMFHLADLVSFVAQSVVGGTHVILPGFDPPAVLDGIELHTITNILLVPTVIQMLVDNLVGSPTTTC